MKKLLFLFGVEGERFKNKKKTILPIRVIFPTSIAKSSVRFF